jgi:hypothetical protein
MLFVCVKSDLTVYSLVELAAAACTHTHTEGSKASSTATSSSSRRLVFSCALGAMQHNYVPERRYGCEYHVTVLQQYLQRKLSLTTNRNICAVVA